MLAREDGGMSIPLPVTWNGWVPKGIEKALGTCGFGGVRRPAPNVITDAARPGRRLTSFPLARTSEDRTLTIALLLGRS